MAETGSGSGSGSGATPPVVVEPAAPDAGTSATATGAQPSDDAGAGSGPSADTAVAGAPSDVSRAQLIVFGQARAVEAYLHFLGVRGDVDVSTSRYPWAAATGYYPMLKDGHVIAGGDSEILGYLQHKYSTQARANVTGTAGNDGSVNAADEAAYASMVSTELSDVEVYAQWCFPGAYSATKRAVARLTIFPLSLVLPSYMRRDMQRRLIARRLETPRQMVVRAKRCYRSLAAKLEASTGAFLFGERGSAADALLYGHLLVATQSDVLKDLVAAHASLLRFYEHVRSTHFAEDPRYTPPAPPSAQDTEVTGGFMFSPNTTRVLVVGSVVVYILAARFL